MAILVKEREDLLFPASLIRVSDSLYSDIVRYVEAHHGRAIKKLTRSMLVQAWEDVYLTLFPDGKEEHNLPVKLLLPVRINRMEFVRSHIALAHAQAEFPFRAQYWMHGEVAELVSKLIGLPTGGDEVTIDGGIIFKVPLVGRSFPRRVANGPHHLNGHGQESYVTQREFRAGKYSPLR